MAHAIRKRPRIISVNGIIGFLYSSLQIIAISAPSIRNVASWYPMLYGTLIALRFISLVGVWHMKKWGFELYIYVTIIKIAIQILLGDMGFSFKFDLLYSSIFLVTMIFYHKKLLRGL